MMLPSRHYISDYQRFLQELLQRKPELAREQQDGRAIWWDKIPRDLAERKTMEQGRVPQQAYVYQNKV